SFRSPRLPDYRQAVRRYGRLLESLPIGATRTILPTPETPGRRSYGPKISPILPRRPFHLRFGGISSRDRGRMGRLHGGPAPTRWEECSHRDVHQGSILAESGRPTL